jgi:hypothetical protein
MGMKKGSSARRTSVTCYQICNDTGAWCDLPLREFGKGRFIIAAMSSSPDVAQIRFTNAIALFDEFVRATVKHPDAATLRGLEGRFALRVQVQPSYWSQIKSRSRQIGERLARQFEQLCHKPYGWMDQDHSGSPVNTAAAPAPAAAGSGQADSSTPQDDDERFIVGLVLTYYRRHPQRARTRLLDLLGEVLTPGTANAKPAAPTAARGNAAPLTGAAPPKTSAPTAPAASDGHDLWLRSQARVAPLKQKK